MKSVKNIETEHIRTLIAKEIELGFLYIDASTRKHFPKKSQHTLVALDSSKKFHEFQYNAVHNRIFGLSKWFKKHGFEPKDQVQVLSEDSGFRLKVVHAHSKEKPEYSADELEQIVDLSGLSTMAKGDIVEDRIKEIILLYGQGELSVYKPVSDNEGIDLIIVKNGIFQPLFLQVKGRFKLQNGSSLLCDVRLKTFKPHHSYFVVGAFFDPVTLDVYDRLLFVPSKIVQREGTLVNKGKDERRRIITNLVTPKKDKWVGYTMSKADFVSSILAKFEEMEKYLK